VSADFCRCHDKKPADVRVCLGCGKNIVPGSESHGNIRAEIRRIELEIRTLNRRVQSLKQQAGL
jgi:hypothetical protein